MEEICKITCFYHVSSLLNIAKKRYHSLPKYFVLNDYLQQMKWDVCTIKYILDTGLINFHS